MMNCRLSPLALGLALGVFWGISMLIMGLLARYLEYGEVFVSSMGTLYVGYDTSLLGILIGSIIGFIDAFIGGVILAWLYNLFARCCCYGSCDTTEVTRTKGTRKATTKKIE